MILFIHFTGTLEKNGGMSLAVVSERRFSSRLSLMVRVSAADKLVLRESRADT